MQTPATIMGKIFSELTPYSSVTSCVDFHPAEPGLLTTSGLDRKVQLFSVNKSRASQRIQTLVLPDLPVYQSKFILNGKQLIIAGNRRHFYYYDLDSNKLEKIPGIQGLGLFSSSASKSQDGFSSLSVSSFLQTRRVKITLPSLQVTLEPRLCSLRKLRSWPSKSR